MKVLQHHHPRLRRSNAGGTYEHTPDHSLNPPTVEFTCTERPIYGSSRVGLFGSSYILRERNVRDTNPVRNETGIVTQVVYTTATEALPEGQAVRLLGNKQYEISNHLGNVLVVVSDVKMIVQDGGTITGYAAQIISATDYSPFGVALEGRTFSSETYRFGFNGKEKDDEGMGGGGQTYDYGFRIYNPGLAKFLSVDPLRKDYPELTPYQYASNTPINSIDLDGLESAICIRWFDANNNYIGFTVINVVNAADQLTFGANNAQSVLYIQATTNQTNAVDAMEQSRYRFLADMSNSNARLNNGSVGVRAFLTNPQNGIVDAQGNLLNGVAFIEPQLQPQEKLGYDDNNSVLDARAASADPRDDNYGKDFSQTNNPITIYFTYGSSEFDPNLAIANDPSTNQTDLNKAITRLNRNTDLTATITGHCSVPQTTNVNPQLGRDRATCVTGLLTNSLGCGERVINGGGQGSQSATGNNEADQKVVINFNIQRR